MGLLRQATTGKGNFSYEHYAAIRTDSEHVNTVQTNYKSVLVKSLSSHYLLLIGY